MALDFPANPTNGQVYGSYTYNSTVGAWQSREDSRTVAVLSSTVPASANPGDIWINTNDGISFVYYDDGTSAQWMEMLPSGVPLLNTKADLSGATFTGNVTAPRFISNIATGTAPFGVTSTTLVSNLNADLLDGQHAAAFSPVAGSSSITTVGIITSGTWNGSTVAVANGGTGATSASSALSNLGAAPLAGASFTGAISGTSASFSGSVSGTQIVGTTPNDSGSTGGIGVKAPAGGSQTSAYVQFVNNAYSAQWAAIEATSAGIMNLSASYVRKPSQPSFLAYRIGGNNWSQGTGTLPFHATKHNVGGNYNTSNYRFTAPVAGTYIFTLHYNVYSASGVVTQASFIINGSTQYSGNRFNTAGGDQDSTASVTVYLNAGDYVEPRANLSASMSMSSGEYWSHFSGFLLG